jgi:hypothetical protein
MKSIRSALQERINQLRVQLWFAWIRHKSQLTAYYALEKLLIPGGFVSSANGALSHRNRMKGYAQGKHVPRPDFVDHVEKVFAGSRALLEHVYWQILDPGLDVIEHRSAWLSELGADVHQILFEPTQMATDRLAKRRKANCRQLRQLENLGTFEALAATAFLLREAQAENNMDLAFDCARSFWVVLLLIGTSIPFLNILPALTQLAGFALLDQVQYQGEQVAIADVPIGRYESMLRNYCLAMEDSGQLHWDWASWVRERLLLIRGAKGPDAFRALRLPTIATPELQADPSRYLTFLYNELSRATTFAYLADEMADE